MESLNTFLSLSPVLLRGAVSAVLIAGGALVVATLGGAVLAIAHSFGGLRVRAPINLFVDGCAMCRRWPICF
ncbi:hypothetical protein [Pseudomonas viridiflava]|uniref:hypothetical protein n=1 Tax=Pseudomonas viridiflava TaxID=33069 RepID=UPI000F069A32|nr:hypothetical protein [Pseudomonas viridiflava]